MERFFCSVQDLQKQLLYLVKFEVMILNPKFPLYLPGVENSNNDNVSIIGASLREDITILGYFVSGNGGLEIQVQNKYATKEYTSFSDILKYLTLFRESVSIISKSLFFRLTSRVICSEGKIETSSLLK